MVVGGGGNRGGGKGRRRKRMRMILKNFKHTLKNLETYYLHSHFFVIRTTTIIFIL